MNTTLMITIYVVIDDLMKTLGHTTHRLAGISDAEIVTIALIAAASFRNNHAQTLFLLHEGRYVAHKLSVSRFSRRIHALREWLVLASETLGELLIQQQAFVATFIIDSFPIPICKNIRVSQCKLVHGKQYKGKYGYRHKENFFGFRLHLVCTTDRIPVSFTILPASYHDLTPVYELTTGLPDRSWVLGDKAYNSQDVEEITRWTPGGTLIPHRRDNTVSNPLDERCALREYRYRIEQLFSQLEDMGIKSLHATTLPGLELKIHASILAAIFLNIS